MGRYMATTIQSIILVEVCTRDWPPIISVPDKRSRILEVIVMRRLLTWVRRIWSGEGMGKG
jgi:hypothetical protein